MTTTATSATIRTVAGLTTTTVRRPLTETTLRSRAKVLTVIAVRYRELTDPQQSRGNRGDGVHVPLMPESYTPTVREFERLMAVMRNQARQQAYAGTALGTLRWHLLEWYVKAEHVTVRPQLKVEKNKRGKLQRLKVDDVGAPLSVDDEGHALTRAIRHPDARQLKADAGIRWMAERWGLVSEPMLLVDKPEKRAA